MQIPTMAESYGWCGITPLEYLNYTPAELEFMIKIKKIQAGYEEPREPMTNPEMANVCQVIEEAMKLKGMK